jgi:DNA repair protein RadA/Sms
MNHAGSVRGLLAPLHALAAKHNCAIVLVRHLNKANDQSAKYRGQGSVDFFSACRSAFQVIPDWADPDKRHIVHIKSNLGPMQPTLEFSVANDAFTFGGTNFHSAEHLYKRLADASKNSGEDSSSRQDDSVKSSL